MLVLPIHPMHLFLCKIDLDRELYFLMFPTTEITRERKRGGQQEKTYRETVATQGSQWTPRIKLQKLLFLIEKKKNTLPRCACRA